MGDSAGGEVDDWGGGGAERVGGILTRVLTKWTVASITHLGIRF